MRIAMVSEHASPLALLGGEDAGGQNVYVAAVATELGRRGHQVVVHTRRSDADTPRRVPFTDNVVVDHVDAGPAETIPKDDIWPHIDEFARDLRRVWREDRPDVVHAHFWMSGIAALDAARERDVPVLQTFHALGIVKRRHQGAADTSPPDRVPAEQRIVDEADRIVATCSDEAFELGLLGAPMSRVSIVPCGVNLRNFGPDGPATPRDDRYRHRISVVSRLVPRKGIDDVIRALDDIPDTELLIAGGPKREDLDRDEEVRRLRGIADDVGVADRVTFLGALERSEVPPVMRSSDVVVTVPWYEPFGIVPLEIMACGVPVVTSAVGGMIDTVVDGVTGVHVPPRDPAAVAAAVRRLLDDPELRSELGRNGYERVRQRFTWARVADGLLDAYADALLGSPARRRQAVSG
jgi:D-inositol-3-phosphate glycosyltransferase